MDRFDAAMSRFMNRQNLNRYRRLASHRTDDAKRIAILKQLAEERIKFVQDINRTPLRGEAYLLIRRSDRDENHIVVKQ
jgi:hypothetical protein